jgi:hypothetical protein
MIYRDCLCDDVMRVSSGEGGERETQGILKTTMMGFGPQVDGSSSSVRMVFINNGRGNIRC